MAAGDTAFVHRNSQWLALVGYYWDGGDARYPALIAQGHEWQNQFYNSVLLGEQALFSGTGAYQNFPDVSLKNAGAAYYGDNLARLKMVKQKYDPSRLFNFSQAI